jgi:hypothetical protein
MIFAVSFKIIIQWALHDETLLSNKKKKNTLIIAVLYNRSKKKHYFLFYSSIRTIQKWRQNFFTVSYTKNCRIS